MAGRAVRALNWKLLLPAAISEPGLRIEAMAIWPTTTCWPLEYCARILPPSLKPTLDKLAAADPSCASAEVAQVTPLAYQPEALARDAPARSPSLALRVGMIPP